MSFPLDFFPKKSGNLFKFLEYSLAVYPYTGNNFLCKFRNGKRIAAIEMESGDSYMWVGEMLFEFNSEEDRVIAFKKRNFDEDMEEIYSIPYFDHLIFNFSFIRTTSDGRYMYSNTPDSICNIHDIKTGKVVKEIDTGPIENVSIYFREISNDLRYTLIEKNDGSKDSFYLIGEEDFYELSSGEIPTYYLFSMDSNYLVLGFHHQIVVHKCSTGEKLHILDFSTPKDTTHPQLYLSALGRFYVYIPQVGHFHFDEVKGKFKSVNQANVEQFPDYLKYRFYEAHAQISRSGQLEIYGKDLVKEEPFKLEYQLDFPFGYDNIEYTRIYLADYKLPLTKITKLLPVILVLKKTLATEYPLSFPPGIIKEIVYYLIIDIIPYVPNSLVSYMIESAEKLNLTQSEFENGLYHSFRV